MPDRAALKAEVAAPAPVAQQVNVRDRSGTVAPAAKQRVLAAVKAEGGGDLTEHHLSVLASSGDVDLYRGNSTRLLIDGPATFAAMKSAIEQARGRVLLESYIIEDSHLGDQLSALLTRKVAQGVSVALMYDGVGSRGNAEFFDQLAESGVSVCKFNPVNPLERPGYWGINHRNHRKVLVVDDEVAFTGGINISRAYSVGSSSIGRSGGHDDESLQRGWRDTHIELRGPVVPAFARGFAAVWTSQGCPGVLGSAPPATRTAPGQRVVKLLESDPRDPSNRIYTALLQAIEAAQRSVHLTMAYFAPGGDMVAALADAARRGVEVSLVLPGRSDFALVLHAGRSYYEELLSAGVRIHEMDQAVMHAKTAVIDGVFSTVGSSNMDWRSWVANNEINVVVLGRDFGKELEAVFQRDLKHSRAVHIDAWRRRGLAARVMEQIGRLAERLL
ncbi:MAG: cardiolipin synthase B [Burkholderiaceae bacterium]|nr:cardiolipin synthase B [Burkholderiaceae bacterium]